MKNVQPPQILTDLYRDLRDRRLLLPALALVVALSAFHMILSSSATPMGTAPSCTGARGARPAGNLATRCSSRWRGGSRLG